MNILLKSILPTIIAQLPYEEKRIPITSSSIIVVALVEKLMPKSFDEQMQKKVWGVAWRLVKSIDEDKKLEKNVDNIIDSVHMIIDREIRRP